jgi:hypothetical protein
VDLDTVGNFMGLVGFHVADQHVGRAPDDPDPAVQLDGDRGVRDMDGRALARIGPVGRRPRNPRPSSLVSGLGRTRSSSREHKSKIASASPSVRIPSSGTWNWATSS